MTRAAIPRGIPWSLEQGGCAALPLPADESIAAVARAQVGGLLPTMGLAVQDRHDLVVMVSELATNVFQHATSGDGLPGAELWVYQRRDEHGRDELVVKAFDTLPEWRTAPSGRAEPSGDLLDHGRGLRLVEILAKGRWGHHPSRSRLSHPAVRGKATWFALPVTRTSHGRRHPRHVDDPHAMRTLRGLLAQRGVDRFEPKEELGVTVLSDSRDLTVRCETAIFRWRARSGETGTLPVTDITEVCEQLVRLHEAMLHEAMLREAVPHRAVPPQAVPPEDDRG
jgi:anti-sigma regulatory factor (Ser/Thr protein kinase)